MAVSTLHFGLSPEFYGWPPLSPQDASLGVTDSHPQLHHRNTRAIARLLCVKPKPSALYLRTSWICTLPQYPEALSIPTKMTDITKPTSIPSICIDCRCVRPAEHIATYPVKYTETVVLGHDYTQYASYILPAGPQTKYGVSHGLSTPLDRLFAMPSCYHTTFVASEPLIH